MDSGENKKYEDKTIELKFSEEIFFLMKNLPPHSFIKRE